VPNFTCREVKLYANKIGWTLVDGLIKENDLQIFENRKPIENYVTNL